jgi:hypothetical protein
MLGIVPKREQETGEQNREEADFALSLFVPFELSTG